MPDFLLYMVATAFLYSTPLIVLLLLIRRRVHGHVVSAFLALAFASATAFSLWRIEWFDVWRHGMPPVKYMLLAYGPYLAAFAFIGWTVGRFIVRLPKRAG